MKRFALPSFQLVPILGVLALASACTDASAPDPHGSLRPGTPTPAIQGNVPPPPARTAVVITVASTPVTGIFSGVYFANGGILESLAASGELADPTLGWNGTAWLRLDNTQTLSAVSASANARFQITRGSLSDPLAGNLSGRGTLVIEGHKITIDRVTSFTPNPNCNFPTLPCAVITFDASVDGDPGHHGVAAAFDREFCTADPEFWDFFPGDEESPPELFCGSGS